MVSAIHPRHPGLTFDCTVKVEHVLRHPDVWPELAAAGCLFIVSAFESVDDTILGYLDKGHATAEASEAVILLRRYGIEVRPSWLPFTPWTTIEGLVDLLDFVIAHDLVRNVDPVQYTVRLLLPEGSLLLDRPEMTPHLGSFDADRLGWAWSHPDPAVDQLQHELVGLVEARVDQESALTFEEIDKLIRSRAATVRPRPAAGAVSSGPSGPRARLTESGLRCSEPPEAQLAPLSVR